MLKLKSLNKSFDDEKILEDVSLTLEIGKIYGICGINGSGKSTLIRHMAGVYKADSGSVLYNGEEVFENIKAKKDIIFLSDSPFYFQNHSINDMKKFFATYYDFDNELFDRLKELFKLDLNKKINNFSKGMKKQAEILLGLCLNGKIILIDETFDGLDPEISLKIKSILIDISAEKDMAILISSHNLWHLDAICDYIFLLDHTKLSLQKDINEESNYFKVQLFFKDKTKKEILEMLNLNVVNVKELGSILNIVVEGTLEEISEEVNKYNPDVFDILPFTFEEKFVYEVGGRKND